MVGKSRQQSLEQLTLCLQSEKENHERSPASVQPLPSTFTLQDGPLGFPLLRKPLPLRTLDILFLGPQSSALPVDANV